jgi:hypothetical protein
MDVPHEQTVSLVERRAERRHRVLKPGHIVFNRGYTVFDCIVRNLSPCGAMLELAMLSAVPRQFDLMIDRRDPPFHCVVRWRSGTQIGVAFLDADVPMAA